jgi:hypothetical protein
VTIMDKHNIYLFIFYTDRLNNVVAGQHSVLSVSWLL